MRMSSSTTVKPASKNDLPSRHRFLRRKSSCCAASPSGSPGWLTHIPPETIIRCNTSASIWTPREKRWASKRAIVDFPAAIMPVTTIRAGLYSLEELVFLTSALRDSCGWFSCFMGVFSFTDRDLEQVIVLVVLPWLCIPEAESQPSLLAIAR